MIENWKDNIDNYWLIQYPDGYMVFHAPSTGQVLFSDVDVEVETVDAMLAAGVKIVDWEDFRQYIQSQLK